MQVKIPKTIKSHVSWYEIQYQDQQFHYIRFLLFGTLHVVPEIDNTNLQNSNKNSRFIFNQIRKKLPIMYRNITIMVMQVSHNQLINTGKIPKMTF